MKSIVFLISFLFISLLQAQDTIIMKLDPDSIRVGEMAKLTWELRIPSSATLTSSPEFSDSTGNIQFLSKGNMKKSKQGREWLYQREFTLSAYDSGLFSLPPLKAVWVDGNDTFNTLSDSLFLYATTVEVDTTTAARDIKDIMTVETPSDFSWLYYTAAGIILGVIVFFIIRHFRRKKTPEQVAIIQVDPWEDALSKLKKMQEQRRWLAATPKEYFTEITDVIRQYLIAGHNIPAAEMISAEIMVSVNQAAFSNELQLSLKQVLLMADMAKFAKFKPQPGEEENALSMAILFIHDSKPQKSAESHEMDQ